MRKHFICPISSVYPSTTVAATTSIESGCSPVETAWLGWDLYFDEIGENVAVFRSTLQKNGEPAADYNIAAKYIPYKSIFQRIEEVNGSKTAYYVSPFSKHNVKSVKDIRKTVYRLSKKRKHKYIYTYWYQPDKAMHDFGVNSQEVHEQILMINSKVENNAGEILLGRRTDNHLWGYFGGSVEIDEKVEDCARRELLEETGLIADAR